MKHKRYIWHGEDVGFVPEDESEEHLSSTLYSPTPWTLIHGWSSSRTPPNTIDIADANGHDVANNRANARLTVAAVNSYAKHCGPRAIECAEADLLGELLIACENLVEAVASSLNSDEFVERHLVKAQAVLAKAKGNA